MNKDMKKGLLPQHGKKSSRAVEKNELGLLNGVVVPCLLNILGVILFLRLSWAVGQAGWLGTLGMFAIGESLSVLTILSLAAITSNGAIRGGGSYFMISRSLGPEFGGSIGVMFYLAYAVGTTFYVIGFATEVAETWFDPDLSTNEKRWYTTAVASGALAVVGGISYLGAGYFTKINVPLFGFQLGVILVGIGSMLFRSEFEIPTANDPNGTFLGPNIDTLNDNMYPDFQYHEYCGDKKCTFAIVFSIIFPAMTGIMEGANLSGDLKDPAKTIGPGTLLAVFFSILVYITMIFSFGSAFDRYTLLNNMVPMQSVSPSEYIIVAGVVTSSFSSALGSMFGGSRILQALARDRLPFRQLRFFAKGSIKGDEPRRAVLFTWALAQAACLLGDLDVVSPIISSFFCISYGTVNFAALVLAVTGTPNWRPRFRYFSKWSAFAGFAINIGVLFFLNVWYAVAAIGVLLLLFIYIAYNGPVTEWGDVSQALLFHQVRKYLLRMDSKKEHVKFWRPSVLLLVDELDGPLISFCNNLKPVKVPAFICADLSSIRSTVTWSTYKVLAGAYKGPYVDRKGGLYVIGSVLVGDLHRLSKETFRIRTSWKDFVAKAHVKAFPQVAVAPTARIGYQNLMLCSGLGAMRPNTVVLPIWAPRTEEQPDRL